MKIRIFASVVLLMVATLFAPITVQAQTYPTRPVMLVVPFAPGGATDILGRIIAQNLGEYLGQPVLVNNRAGASTIMGAEFTAKASPDGYTILIGTTSTFVVNTVVYKNLPYNVAQDFAPITQLVTTPLFFIVMSPALPVKTVSELVALAKAKPGELIYSSTGTGSVSHLGGLLFEQMTGVKLVHVPYKGNAPSVVDLVAGRVHFTFTGLTSVKSLVQSGKLRLLAATTDKRHPSYPNLPTVAESYPGYWAGTWYGMVTRAGTPRPIIDKLNREVIRVLQAPDVKDKLDVEGFTPATGTPEAMAKLIAEDTQKVRSIASNIQAE